MTRAFAAFLPQLIVAGTLLALMVADALVPEGRKVWLAPLAGLGAAAALVAALLAAPGVIGTEASLFAGAVTADAFSLFFDVVFLLLTLAVLALAPAYLDRHEVHQGEFYILLVAALAGMMILVAATNLVTIFIGIELLSIALYVLSAFMRREEASQEAGMKYLLIGGFASGFLLYGMALLYGGTATTSVTAIARVLPHLAGESLTFSLLGIVLILVGFAYKASAAPFHTWTPDVYQGAPTPVVAFMAVGTKLAAIAVFLRVFVVAFPAAYARWSVILGAVSALSMIVGAVGALRQSDVKRLLAYSSVAQAGYLLLAAVAGGQAGIVSGLFYLAAYGCMTFGAFAVVTLVSGKGPVTVEGLRGLGFRTPVVGGLLALFMLSLAGFPPTVGFMGKLFVFEAAIRSGLTGLTVVAIVSSAISIYYYLRVVALIYSRPDAEVEAPPVDPWGTGAVAFAGALTLLLGIFPGVLYGLAQRSSLL